MLAGDWLPFSILLEFDDPALRVDGDCYTLYENPQVVALLHLFSPQLCYMVPSLHLESYNIVKNCEFVSAVFEVEHFT